MQGIRILAVGLAALVGLMLTATEASAQSGGFDTGSGTPPFGLKVEGDAKGTKLTGTLAVESINVKAPNPIDGSIEADEVRIALRLRRGNELHTLVGRIFASDTATVCENDPGPGLHDCLDLLATGDLQDAIIAVLGDALLGTFFEPECGPDGTACNFEIRIKSLEEFDIADLDVGGGVIVRYVLADIVVVVD